MAKKSYFWGSAKEQKYIYHKVFPRVTSRHQKFMPYIIFYRVLVREINDIRYMYQNIIIISRLSISSFVKLFSKLKKKF